MKKILVTLGACALLSGCMATQPLREIAVDTNRLVAETANDQTMLNILRAKDRMPMHFTSFTALRGNLSISGTAALDGSLPDDGLQRTFDATGAITGATRTRGVNTVTPKLSATVAANPNFDLAVYDTKQFQQGFLTPVSESLIEYYLQSGWPEDFLTALFVSRVDVTIDDGVSPALSLVNSPDSEDFGKFNGAARMVSRAKPGSATALMPLSQLGQDVDLAALSSLDGTRYDVALMESDTFGGGKQVFLVRRRGDSRGISFDNLREGLRAASGATAIPALSGCGEFKSLFSIAAGESLSQSTAECTSNGGTVKLTVDIHLRSPEAVLYFLGSYVRCDLGEQDEANPCVPYRIGGGEKVIQIARGWSRHSLFQVRHRNAEFAMNEPVYRDGVPDHRGSQALVLVQQLVNLQKSADSLPSTSSVRLIP